MGLTDDAKLKVYVQQCRWDLDILSWTGLKLVVTTLSATLGAQILICHSSPNITSITKAKKLGQFVPSFLQQSDINMKDHTCLLTDLGQPP
jgi:hypothetical protein